MQKSKKPIQFGLVALLFTAFSLSSCEEKTPGPTAPGGTDLSAPVIDKERYGFETVARFKRQEGLGIPPFSSMTSHAMSVSADSIGLVWQENDSYQQQGTEVFFVGRAKQNKLDTALTRRSAYKANFAFKYKSVDYFHSSFAGSVTETQLKFQMTAQGKYIGHYPGGFYNYNGRLQHSYGVGFIEFQNIPRFGARPVLTEFLYGSWTPPLPGEPKGIPIADGTFTTPDGTQLIAAQYSSDTLAIQDVATRVELTTIQKHYKFPTIAKVRSAGHTFADNAVNLMVVKTTSTAAFILTKTTGLISVHKYDFASKELSAYYTIPIALTNKLGITNGSNDYDLLDDQGRIYYTGLIGEGSTQIYRRGPNGEEAIGKFLPLVNYKLGSFHPQDGYLYCTIAPLSSDAPKQRIEVLRLQIP